MEENSAKFAKMARLLAFIHIITGVLLLVFGIADKLVQYKRQQESGGGLSRNLDRDMGEQYISLVMNS